MNKLKKWISNKHENGDVVESCKPLIMLPMMICASIAMYQGFRATDNCEKFGLALIAICFAWQAGWGMRMMRFYSDELKSRKENN